jgi:hypothetical protein
VSDAIETRGPARSTAEPEPPVDDSPIPSPLIVFEGDDALVCVDDTCVPPDVPR